MTASRARLALASWLAALLVILAATWQAIVDPQGATSPEEVALVFGFGFGFMTVGAILVARRPDEPVSRISLAIGIVTITATGMRSLSIVLDELAGPIPDAGLLVAVISSTLWSAALVAWGFLLVRFPNGRGTDRLSAAADLLLALALVGSVLAAFAPGPINLSWLPPAENPIGIPALDGPLLSAVLGIGLLSFVAGLGLSFAVLVRRYRRAGPVVRAQIRWVGAAGVLPVVVFPFVLVLGSLYTLWFTLTALLPAAIGIAILRYRLYEIDRIIGRTLAYLVVTTLLAAVFVASNLLMQALVAGAIGDGTLVIAASTLLVAALFQPIRHRVQRPIDRRFNRAHLDASRVVSAFGLRARDEVDLRRIQEAVIAAADDAVAPAGASVWLRAAS
jgi:hypothetical protein